MNRRDLLRTSLFAGTLGVLGAGGLALGAAPVSYRAAFANALAERPWLLGFEGTTRTGFDTARLSVTGRLPAALEGTLYRNGPAVHEVGGLRYRHWFDGDGMVQAFRFDNGRIAHRGRVIATLKRAEEARAGRALFPTFGTVPPDPRPVTSPDLINTASISVLPHHGRLFALWEGGSPFEIDHETLETRGVHAFSESTGGMPFSAHPRVEQDGTLWNFGYVSSAESIVLWHIDPRGKLKRTGLIKTTPMSMPHDFIVTARHLVLLLPPFHFSSEGDGSFLDAHRWYPERPTRVLVVDKSDFSRYRFFELPAQWVFHFGNGWEDEAGVIRFDGARSEDPSAMTRTFREVMRGDYAAAPATRHTLYRIDLGTGSATETPLTGSGIETEFPVIDPRVATQRHRKVVVLSADAAKVAAHPLLDSVSVLDIERGDMDTWRYPEHCMPEEHVFVPADGGSEGEGWLLGTFLDFKAGVSGINVFNATDIASGPLATASLPYPLPLGLHGRYVAA